MPSETTPRILRRSSVKPPGSVAPDGAYGTTIPATTFGAPHTTVVVPDPVSTSTRLSLSAFGCFATSSALAALHAEDLAPGRVERLDLEPEVVERVRDRDGIGLDAA